MCRRGGENIHGMTKQTFQLHYDTETKMSYVKKVIDEVQKNHLECDNEIITGFMPQMLDQQGRVHKLCPVRAFENYTNNLNKKCESLWQRPAKKFPTTEGKAWYDNVVVGHNTHDKFMTKLSEDCNLSKKYTNHCIRVTGITSLKRGNFSDKQVMAITGHKSIDSLAIYQRVKSDEKLMMGMCLTFSLLRPEDVIFMQNSLEIENIPKQVHALPAPIQENTTPATPPPAKRMLTESPKIQSNELVPLENAITPYQPQPKINDSPNFDLMALIAEVENDELPDDQLLLAASQCEAQLPPTMNNLMPITTTTASSTTAVMKRISNPTPTFTNCTFGTIGTLNIHIHKH